MNLTADQLAELLVGILRAHHAVIDAVDRALPGFRNTHLIPVLSIAANMRTAEPRMIDLPSRMLLRMQGRAAVDLATIKQDIARLTSGASATPAPSAAPPAAAAPAVAAAPAPSAGGGELDFAKS